MGEVVDGVGGIAPGTRFGRYACIRRLARGGMAELYLAANVDQPQFGKLFVIKRILPHLVEDADFVGMFRNEVSIAATLDHPGIGQLVDFGVRGEEHYLVMEYVHGTDVRRLIAAAAERKALPRAVGIAIVSRAADALHYAHEKRDKDGNPLEIVHRDVSPANVLVSHDGGVKVIDFGIAAAMANTRTTRAGTIKGKIGYLSPEQCRGAVIGRRSDVFSLGVLLYELTTLTRLFRGLNEFAIMNRIIDGNVPRPSAVVPDYPPQLESTVMRALRVDPSQRHATARELQRELEEFALETKLDLSTRTLAATMADLFGDRPYPVETAITEVEPRTDPPSAAPRRTAALPFALAGLLGAAGFAAGAVVGDPSTEADPTPPTDEPRTPAAALESAPPISSAASVEPPVTHAPSEVEKTEPASAAAAPPVPEEPVRKKSPRNRSKTKKRRSPKSPPKPKGPSVLPPQWRKP